MKVVQLICNHQVLVRFRLGAPENMAVFAVVLTNIGLPVERFAERWLAVVRVSIADRLSKRKTSAQKKDHRIGGLCIFGKCLG